MRACHIITGDWTSRHAMRRNCWPSAQKYYAGRPATDDRNFLCLGTGYSKRPDDLVSIAVLTTSRVADLARRSDAGPLFPPHPLRPRPSPSGEHLGALAPGTWHLSPSPSHQESSIVRCIHSACSGLFPNRSFPPSHRAAGSYRYRRDRRCVVEPWVDRSSCRNLPDQ